MTATAPYRLYEPDVLSSHVVFNSPHSGRFYPDSLLRRSRLCRLRIRASEDAFVDRLFGAAPAAGAPLLAAVWPRAWVDLNRGPAELDPALIEGARSEGLNQRIAAGLGVVPRIVSEGTPIYQGKLSLAEAEARIESVHRPYHQRLDSLLARAHRRYGRAILFDCHSMPAEALRSAPRVRGRRPEIVLGDRFGAAAHREIVDTVQAVFEDAGFAVARNAPFAGGYITQRYGRPSRGSHAVQIEIDRGLYLDPRTVRPRSTFDALVARLSLVVGELCTHFGLPGAMAAE